MGIKIGGRNLTNLRYADDTALLVDNITSMKRILYRVDAAGQAAGLKLNAKKTKVLYTNANKNQTQQTIQIEKTDLENVDNFKYLGSVKSKDGTCHKDIIARIGMAKQKLVQLNNIWKDRSIPTSMKLDLLKCLIWTVMIYGCEAWTLRTSDETRLEAAEMWCYRRLLRVSWKDKRTNDSILTELSVQKQILKEINGRKLRYVGHASRNTKTDLMKTVLQGKTEAKRNSGRPPTSYMNNIKDVCGLNINEIAQKSENREDWRTFVASSVAANIEHDETNG